MHQFGDVGRVFDHLHRLALGVQDRAVAGLDEDLAPALGDAFELAGEGFTPGQLVPEGPVFRRVLFRRIDEQAVMLAANLGLGVAHHIQEIVVGVQDGSVEAELDHRLGFADGVDLPAEIFQQGLEILGVLFDGGGG